MGASDGRSEPALGFLTVLEHEQHGLIGGYLLLNPAGRPLEFHCTAPVKPNRAQQILYGPTLRPYLYGEQIGQLLLSKGSVEPLLVCTDVAPAVSVRQFVSWPVALIRNEQPAAADPAPSTESTWRLDPGHGTGLDLVDFHVGRNRLAITADYPSDQVQILDRLQTAASFDFAEPFERIREAIEEAHKNGPAARA